MVFVNVFVKLEIGVRSAVKAKMVCYVESLSCIECRNDLIREASVDLMVTI